MTAMDATAKQLANIEAATGLSLASFVDRIRTAELEKHGEIVKFLKQDLGLTHGNANLIAAKSREILAGGPASEAELLDGQFKGAKANMRELFDALEQMVGEFDARVVQKTGVSYRTTRKQFALVKVASGKRIELGLNLPSTPDDARVSEVGGMCSHRVNLASSADIDATLSSWIDAAREYCA